MTRHLDKVDVVHQSSCMDIATGLGDSRRHRNLGVHELIGDF